MDVVVSYDRVSSGQCARSSLFYAIFVTSSGRARESSETGLAWCMASRGFLYIGCNEVFTRSRLESAYSTSSSRCCDRCGGRKKRGCGSGVDQPRGDGGHLGRSSILHVGCAEGCSLKFTGLQVWRRAEFRG